MAGLELTGFVPRTLSELVTLLEAAFKTAFGANIRVDAQSVNGQLIGIFAERLAELWSESEKVYSTGFIGGSSGSALDDLVALAGVTRNSATNSTVTLNLTGTVSTVIPSGSLVTDSSTGTVWETTAEVTLTGGVDPVAAQSQGTGPIIALATTIDTITTTISGWDTVTNPLDADLGTNVESDAALRTKFQTSFFVTQAGSVGAIVAALLRVTDVLEVNVFENVSDFPDTNGLPGHSIECVVRDGADQDIVDTIGNTKGGGIETFGSSSGTFTDVLGQGVTINFTRPTGIDVFVDVEYTFIAGQFPADGEQQIIDAIVAHGTTLTVGKDVIPIQIIQDIEVAGLSTLVVKVGLDAVNVFELPLAISLRELADIDSSRIAIAAV